MPSAETLERFIARVEQNADVEAIEEFYTEAAPRVGRDLLVAHERRAMARAVWVRSRCVRPVFVNGDQVVIRWVFEFGWKDGSANQIEELAHQRWEGERIAEEPFFYDPGQFVPAAPAGAAAPP
jgi:hypothetical protein